MKNLANCKPSEFFKQTLLIKRNVEKWLTSEDVAEIRKRVPDLEKVTDNMTPAEKGDILVRNEVKMKEQAMKNFMDILEVMLDKKYEETLAVLALCCFVEPEDVDNHTMSEYFSCIYELIQDKAVQDFFRLLMS